MFRSSENPESAVLKSPSAELARARIFFFFCSTSTSNSNSYSGHFRCRNLIFQWVTKKKFSNFDGILPEFAGNLVKILGKFGNFREISCQKVGVAGSVPWTAG